MKQTRAPIVVACHHARCMTHVIDVDSPRPTSNQQKPVIVSREHQPANHNVQNGWLRLSAHIFLSSPLSPFESAVKLRRRRLLSLLQLRELGVHGSAAAAVQTPGEEDSECSD